MSDFLWCLNFLAWWHVWQKGFYEMCSFEKSHSEVNANLLKTTFLTNVLNQRYSTGVHGAPLGASKYVWGAPL